jgi:hypothetical protein
MKSKAEKRILGILTAVFILIFLQLPFAPSLSEAYLYWLTKPSVMVTEPPGDSLNPPYKSGQDITAAWHAFEGGSHYFRIDLASARNEYEVCEWDAEFLMWKKTKFKELKEDPIFHHSENRGTTLEWKINDNYWGDKNIGNLFTLWAATLEPGHTPAITFDTTSAVVVPIPNAAWLLGSGVVALLVLKRRRRTT